jgi:hypothetical protein
MHIHFAFSIRKRLTDVPNNATEDATLLVKYFDETIQNRKVKGRRQQLPSRSPQITLKMKLKPWLKPEYLKHNKLFFPCLPELKRSPCPNQGISSLYDTPLSMIFWLLNTDYKIKNKIEINRLVFVVAFLF